jgi:hypothetical protein
MGQLNVTNSRNTYSSPKESRLCTEQLDAKGPEREKAQLSHPFPLPNPILCFGIPCAHVKLMEGDLRIRKKVTNSRNTYSIPKGDTIAHTESRTQNDWM